MVISFVKMPRRAPHDAQTPPPIYMMRLLLSPDLSVMISSSLYLALYFLIYSRQVSTISSQTTSSNSSIWSALNKSVLLALSLL